MFPMIGAQLFLVKFSDRARKYQHIEINGGNSLSSNVKKLNKHPGSFSIVDIFSFNIFIL